MLCLVLISSGLTLSWISLQQIAFILLEYTVAPAQATTQLFIRHILGSKSFLLRTNNKERWWEKAPFDV